MTRRVVIGQESATPDHATPADFALPQANELEADAAITVNDVPADPPEAFDPLAQLDGMTTVLDAIAPEQRDLQALAATFGGDAERAFAFVRDGIGFDPFRGVLRGADGTLAAGFRERCRPGGAASRPARHALDHVWPLVLPKGAISAHAENSDVPRRPEVGSAWSSTAPASSGMGTTTSYSFVTASGLTEATRRSGASQSGAA